MATGWSRRAAVLGGCAAVVAGFQNAPRLWDIWDDGFDFTPMNRLPGFRTIATSGVSSSGLSGLFAGIGDPNPSDQRDDRILRENLCDVLFHDGPGVSLAIFSDYYCPYCRILDRQVKNLEDEGLVTVRHHETPLFGPPSEWAARGAIAARAQGKGRAYFERMLGTPIRANPGFLRRVGEEIGLDVPLFLAEMTSANTDAVLRQSAGLQRIFGFIGTPSMVVGQTVLQGAISETNLRQLISIERDNAPQTPCG